jgi:hypothetical protein
MWLLLLPLPVWRLLLLLPLLSAWTLLKPCWQLLLLWLLLWLLLLLLLLRAGCRARLEGADRP